ncbi:MAG: hypothetical protein DRJ37_06965 [Thermoprotei archaeon]|nr:MAG: hypothetical protein DRJ37_06965 [Thermoprotei archaeon]
MSVDSTLLAERELGGLAEKIIIYRYKVYSASSIALITIATLLVVYSFSITAPYSPIPAILVFIIAFSAPFAIVAILIKTFKKALRSVNLLISTRGRRLNRTRLNVVALLSYTTPFILFYLTSPLPYWETYAWYFALAVANTSMTLFYERYINELLPELSVRVYTVWSALSLLFAPLIAYLALIDPLKAWPVALITYLFATLISSIQEIYRAEKML